MTIERRSFKEDGSDKRQKIFKWLKATEDTLRERFGVEHLTTIEGVRLRKIVEQVIEEKDEMEKRKRQSLKAGKTDDAWITDMNIPGIQREASVRWLFELYSINADELHGRMTDDASFKEYLRRIRERAVNP